MKLEQELKEIITEVSYKYQAALTTARLARECVRIDIPKSIEMVCIAEQRVGSLKAELEALRLVAKEMAVDATTNR